MTGRDMQAIGTTLILIGVAAGLMGWPLVGAPIGVGLGLALAGQGRSRRELLDAEQRSRQ